eukprot:gene5325-7391_t
MLSISSTPNCAAKQTSHKHSKNGTLSYFYDRIQVIVTGSNDDENYNSNFSMLPVVTGKNTVALYRGVKDQELFIGKKFFIESKTTVIRETAANQFITGLGKHNNICEYVETIFDGQEQLFYLMSKYYQGIDLFELIQNQGALDERRAAKLFSGIINGLEFIHKNGVAHNDLSAMNVLVESDENVRIIDFEMAVQVTRDNHDNLVPLSGNCGGTMKYAAPEKYVDAFQRYFNPMQSDLWSLGVILFLMVAGCELYELPSMNDPRFKYAIMEGNIKSLLYIWKKTDVSDDVIDLISKILKYDPSERLSLQNIRYHPWMMKYIN